MMREDYSIFFCERPVIRGRNMDIQVLGKPLSHPFLVLKRGNEVISELHGTWSAASCNRQTPFAKTLEFSLAAAQITRQAGVLRAAFNNVFPHNNPVNRMCLLTRAGQYDKAVRKLLLQSGEQDIILPKWREAYNLSKLIDSHRIPYVRYAWGNACNCQKTLRAVMDGSALIESEKIVLQLGDAGWSTTQKIQMDTKAKLQCAIIKKAAQKAAL